MLEKQSQALSDQIGGGFEQNWYRRLSEQIKRELAPFAVPAKAAE